jgi:hypothetical protein
MNSVTNTINTNNDINNRQRRQPMKMTLGNNNADISKPKPSGGGSIMAGLDELEDLS